MSDSNDNLLHNVSIIIADNNRLAEKLPVEELAIHNLEQLQELMSQAKKERAEVEKKYQAKKENLPLARADWQRERDLKIILEKYSDQVAASLASESLNFNDWREAISADKNVSSQLVNIYSLRRALEKVAANDLDKAKLLNADSENLWQELWTSDQPEIQEALENSWYRLESAGVMAPEALAEQGIKTPRLAEAFSLDQINLSAELEELAAVAKTIENNPKLSETLYPVSIIYGSKIKGYGTKNADLDLAVFIKPGQDFSQRPQIQESLAGVLKSEKIKGGATEFWLAEKGADLEIKDFPSWDKKLGSSALAHVLFGGAWCGNKEAIKELYEKLMTGYLYSRDKKIQGQDARGLWLSEMERDTLQYRLLHKGYANSNLERGGIQTRNSASIDSSSSFWDSGYRRVATKLFIDKVFLPQL
jgi:predicted nucleotidyltransferase